MFEFICILNMYVCVPIILNRSYFCQRRENPSKHLKNPHSRQFLSLCLLNRLGGAPS